MRKLILGAGALLLLVALTACGGSGGGSAATAQVCETCFFPEEIEDCFAICGDDDQCAEQCVTCDDGFVCVEFVELGQYRCAVFDFDERTCCDGSRRIDCDTDDPI